MSNNFLGFAAGMGAGTALLIAFMIVILFPLISIWALNTLFPVLAIPMTFKTWLATIIVSALLRPAVSTQGK